LGRMEKETHPTKRLLGTTEDTREKEIRATKSKPFKHLPHDKEKEGKCTDEKPKRKAKKKEEGGLVQKLDNFDLFKKCKPRGHVGRGLAQRNQPLKIGERRRLQKSARGDTTEEKTGKGTKKPLGGFVVGRQMVKGDVANKDQAHPRNTP